MKVKRIDLKNIGIMSYFKLYRYKKSVIFLTLLCLFIIINLIVSLIPIRIDFSKGKAYSLSPSTKKIVSKLDNNVTITFYVSSDIPTRLIPFKTDITDLLQEYQKYNSNKISLKITDPKKDAQALTEVQKLGIPELPIQQLEQDKYQVFNTYFGLSVGYKDKKEIIPQLTDLENLEYNITSAIYKIVKKKMDTVGIIGLSDTESPQVDSVLPFKRLLQEQYSLKYFDLSSQETKSTIFSSKLLFIFDNNQKKFEESEIKLLENYLERGGKIIVLIDGIWVTNQLTTQSAGHNLFDFLSKYGIELEKNLILSTSAELVNFGNGQIQLLTAYPFWFKTNIYNQNIGYFSNIGQLTYPWSSSLRLHKNKHIEYYEIVFSPKQSWEQKNTFVLDPQSIPQPSNNNIKQFTLGIQAHLKNKGLITVLPSSRFIDSQFLNRNSDNIELIFNIVNDNVSDGILTGIRSRAISIQQLPNFPGYQKDVFKYGTMFLLPILYSLYGIIRLVRRK